MKKSFLCLLAAGLVLVAPQALGVAWDAYIHCTNSQAHSATSSPKLEDTSAGSRSQCHGKHRNNGVCASTDSQTNTQFSVDCDYHAPLNRTMCVATASCPNNPNRTQVACGSDENAFAGVNSAGSGGRQGYVVCRSGGQKSVKRCDDP